MGGDQCQNSTPQFWMFETHFDVHFSFGCPFILMYNMHSDVYAVYIWSHSDVHSTFGCMSVILMYTLHLDVWKSF